MHGSRDPFGSLEELREAIALIPAPHVLVPIEGARHDLAPPPPSRGPSPGGAAALLAAFEAFVA